MDRQKLAELLAQTEREVADGERHIAELEKRIERMNRSRLDTLIEENLLRAFLETQDIRIKNAKRLREELAQLG